MKEKFQREITCGKIDIDEFLKQRSENLKSYSDTKQKLSTLYILNCFLEKSINTVSV